MSSLTPEQLLAEVEDVLRTMPPRETFGNHTLEHFSWLGRAQAVVRLWNPLQAPFFDGHIAKVNSRSARDVEAGIPAVLTTLNQVRHELRMQTVGPMTVAVGTGAVFDYFDEVRKTIETAKVDLLFVDPYLDAEFVSRYRLLLRTGRRRRANSIIVVARRRTTRSVARANTVSGNVLRAHDSGTSTNANANGCLRPKADIQG